MEPGERNPHCFHSWGYYCLIFFPFLSLGIPPMEHSIFLALFHISTKALKDMEHFQNIWGLHIPQNFYPKHLLAFKHLARSYSLCWTQKICLEVRRLLWVDPSASCFVCKSQHGSQISEVCKWSYSKFNHGNRPEIPRNVSGDWYRACETMGNSSKNQTVHSPHQAMPKRKFSWKFQWELRGKTVGVVEKELIFISGMAGTEMGHNKKQEKL